MVFSQDHDQSDQGDHIEGILPGFWDWLKVQEIKWRVDAERKKIHSSRSAAAQDALPQRSSALARRICPSLALCVISILGALAWQYSNEATRYIGTNWNISLTSPGSVLNANSDLQTAAVKHLKSESPATRSSAELQHQFDSMENDILAVGRIVDRLAARQQQMAQSITMLQFTERNVVEGLSSLPQSATARSVQRQNGQRIVQSEWIAQPHPGLNRQRPAQPPSPLH